MPSNDKRYLGLMIEMLWGQGHGSYAIARRIGLTQAEVRIALRQRKLIKVLNPSQKQAEKRRANRFIRA